MVTPTQKPVPSNVVTDLLFNSEKMDEVINSESYEYVDRLGKNRRTLAGIERDANRAMSSYGYITKKSFELGATLDTPNTILQWAANGEFYRWDGDWSEPKVVPAGSTPESTGGIGRGKWLGVGDAAIRNDLGSDTGDSLVGIPGGAVLSDFNEASLPLIQCNGDIDNTQAIQALLDRGLAIRLSKNHKILITSPLFFRVAGCSLTGDSTAVTLRNQNLANPVWFSVQAEKVDISSLAFDYSGGSCYAGVRTYEGARFFKSNRLSFKNIYGRNVLGNQSVNCMVLETLNCEGFDVDNIHVENVKCVGNGEEGDTTGSISGITIRQYQDQEKGGVIGTVTGNDVWTVNTQGEKVTEDADLIKTVGFKRVPVHVKSVIAHDIGKRLVKNQAKGMTVDSIIYTHNSSIPHRSVVDHQDSGNHVLSCVAKGVIASVYRTTSPTPSSQVVGCSFDGDCETTYVSTDLPAAAIGVVDIASGSQLNVKARVTGGQLGFRITTTDSIGVDDSEFNLNIKSNYAALIRNIANNGSVVDEITINGTLKSLANNAAPGVNVLALNGGVINTIRINGSQTALGSYSPASRMTGVKKLLLNGISTDSINSTMEISDVDEVQIMGITEKNRTKAYPALRLQNVKSGFIHGVTGGKPTGTSVGMVAVYGSSNVILGGINNLNTGQGVTFHDADGNKCLSCKVDSTTSNVTAPSDYTEVNVEWAGAPSYGPAAGRRNIVKRGFIYRNTDTSANTFWNGTTWNNL